MTKVAYSRGPAEAEKSGDTLTAVMSYQAKGKNPAERTWRPAEFDAALAWWFAAAAEGDSVEVFADFDGDGRLVQIRMADPPAFVPPVSDPVRLDAVKRLDGAPNPYTFIPALPRAGLPPGLENRPAPPHGVVDPGSQWSGWLMLRLVTRTPLLLPDAEAAREAADKHKTYPVRVGPDGKPLLHGASVKGALRSAYEAVTDSRLAVFRGHDRPLWYRTTADSGLRVQPARVDSDGHGRLVFRLCDAIRVPLYDKREAAGQRPGRPSARQGTARPAQKAIAVGQIARPDGTADWRKLHKKPVACTLRSTKQGAVVAKVALAEDQRSLSRDGGEPTHGWLSVTGQTIESKTSERLFVATEKEPLIVGEQHHEMWHAVLDSYHEATGRQASGGDAGAESLPRSPHIGTEGEAPRRLEAGELVYLELDSGKVTGVWPVYVSRRPYPAAPSDLLDESLRPAADPDELSPADRLFGWAAPEAGPGRASASGHRGRVRVCEVRCETDDWRTDFPEPGVTLAPLSSPKPAQFRFYQAQDDNGSPMGRDVTKDEGYREGTGLRGRKAYWYASDAPDGYWTPGPGEVGGQFREWQAPAGAAPSQTSSHLGWVRVGTTFTVRLFIDAVPGPELGPLIWLASLEGCALRLGAGKPLGFGAVSVEVDWDATELRTGDALLGCWLGLTSPGPCARDQVQALAAEFQDQAGSGEATLEPVLAAFRKVAAGLPELAKLAAYPRTGRVPEAETYRWFVANERIDKGDVVHGYALPHVLEENQSLPYLQPGK